MEGHHAGEVAIEKSVQTGFFESIVELVEVGSFICDSFATDAFGIDAEIGEEVFEVARGIGEISPEIAGEGAEAAGIELFAVFVDRTAVLGEVGEADMEGLGEGFGASAGLAEDATHDY